MSEAKCGVRYVIELRDGSYFQDLDSYHGGPVETAQRFDSEKAASEFIGQYEYIGIAGGMPVSCDPLPAKAEANSGVRMNVTDWIECTSRRPESDIVVETKIDDHKGCRNQQELKRLGNLWYFPDGSMYVYYIPTHWRPIEEPRP